MIGEYGRVAEVLSERINGPERLLAKDVPAIVGAAERGERVNCYPGTPSDVCHHKAYFISLNSKRHGRGHLKFDAMIQQFLQHMQGRCKRTTQVAVIIADTWDAEELRPWQPLIDQIKQTTHVEAYLLSGVNTTQIQI